MVSKDSERLSTRGLDPDAIRRRLAAGGDPAYPRTLDQDLHEAAYEGAAEAIKVLVEYGADVESVGVDGPPLWDAVRRGHREAVEVLLRAGADPWRPVAAGRSAGSLALIGPLADLFWGLSSVPTLDATALRRQADADALVARYDGWETYCGEGEGFALIAGLDEETAVRRLGLEPAECPVVDEDAYMDAGTTDGGQAIWLGRPPGGGLAVFSAISFNIGSEHLWGPLSSPGPVVAITTNIIVGTDVEIWRDGVCVRSFNTHDSPDEQTSEEEWLCRFYDVSRGSPAPLARALALGSLLTGVEIDEEWFFHAPKHLVLAPPPSGSQG